MDITSDLSGLLTQIFYYYFVGIASGFFLGLSITLLYKVVDIVYKSIK